MRLFLLAGILLWCSQTFSLVAQEDYSQYYREMNPAHGTDLSPREKLPMLKDFLDNALRNQDTTPIIHGNMYLADAYYLQSEFSLGMNYLLEAEKYAAHQKNDLLLGRIHHKKATTYTVLHNYDEAVEVFERALNHSSAAQDSQYLALTYEQLGAVYDYQKKYELANQHYEIAIPLVEKHGDKSQLAATFANYGIVLSDQGQTEEAIKYYKKAIELSKKNEDWRRSVPCTQNLALEYRLMNRFEEALDLYYYCLNLNLKKGWNEFLIYNYKGLAATHEAMGNLDSALFYQRAYHTINDSIIGGEVQSKISELESEVVLQKKELEVFQHKEAAAAQQRKTQNIIFGALLLLIAAMTGIGILIRQKRRTAAQLRENRKNLLRLTKILQEKNAELRNHKSCEVGDGHSQDSLDAPQEATFIDPYETRILTQDDWMYFKELFEKSFPGFLLKFRSSYPEMSEAEERLFLLLKLNMTSREIANTLGIQPESVKKTRSRLRKRLELESSRSLKEFVQHYN